MSFRTSVKLTLLLLVLALIFARLGYWQLQRKAEKELLFEAFASAPVLRLEDAIAGQHRFARVRVTGHYDSERHVLLDNRMLNGRPGVHVLTPFFTSGGRVLLINRGWLPMPPDRSALPAVPTDSAMRSLSGRLNRLPTDGPRLGEADVLEPANWPALVTYFDQAPIEQALGLALEPFLLQLDADEESGFQDREWKAAVMEPGMHGAYAAQWFGLAAAAIVIWFVLGFRRGATTGGQGER